MGAGHRHPQFGVLQRVAMSVFTDCEAVMMITLMRNKIRVKPK
jgi:hypothetical protein